MLARYRKVQNRTSGSRFQKPVYSREMATFSIRKHEFESFLSIIINSVNVHIVDYSGKPDYFIILSNPTICNIVNATLSLSVLLTFKFFMFA
jgi:hypothetical protein